MRTKSLVLLLLALGCGLVAAIGISQVIERNRLSASPAVEMEDIVVALKDIKQGEKLKADNIALKPMPVGTVPEGAYRSIEEALKNTHKLKTMMLKDEPILLAKFQTQNEDLTQKIPTGYRVVSIQADSTVAAGNLLHPGDRVDVLLYIPGSGPNPQPVVKTILQNIAIFSVNDDWGANTAEEVKNPGEKNTRYVTLLVKPDQTKILTLAQMQGTIKLSLRHPDDVTLDKEDDILNTNKVLGARNANSNDVKTEEQALGILDKAKTLLDTLNESALAAAKTTEPPSATISPTIVPAVSPYETFQTTVIEGSQTRVVDLMREKKPRAAWINDGKSSRSSSSGSMPSLPAIEMPAPIAPADQGAPTPSTNNPTF